jgi:hypothetical protein
MMIMLLAKPITTITAWITLEAGAVMAFLLSMFAQVNPNPLGFDARSSMILAYASFLTAIFGGIVAVIQVVTTARNAKVSHELELLRQEALHKQALTEMRDKERQREIEILKLQNETQAKEVIRNNAWIETIKKKHPDEVFGPDPTRDPEPQVVEKLATPFYPPNNTPATPSLNGTPIANNGLSEETLKQANEVQTKAAETMEAANKLTQSV